SDRRGGRAQPGGFASDGIDAAESRSPAKPARPCGSYRCPCLRYSNNETARSCDYFGDCRYRTANAIHYNFECSPLMSQSCFTAGLFIAVRYGTVTPHLRNTFFAKPNGAGVKGPGGARVIRATTNSAAIAS